MVAAGPSVIATRREQAFPVLELAEIQRLHRSGELRRYEAGEALCRIREVGHGLMLVLAGWVEITHNNSEQRYS